MELRFTFHSSKDKNIMSLTMSAQ